MSWQFMFDEKYTKIFTILCNIHSKDDLKIIGDLVKERQRQLEKNC